MTAHISARSGGGKGYACCYLPLAPGGLIFPLAVACPSPPGILREHTLPGLLRPAPTTTTALARGSQPAFWSGACAVPGPGALDGGGDSLLGGGGGGQAQGLTERDGAAAAAPQGLCALFLFLAHSSPRVMDVLAVIGTRSWLWTALSVVQGRSGMGPDVVGGLTSRRLTVGSGAG